jgi:predicted molibdopterin-dependent oxidoreductase YjgC
VTAETAGRIVRLAELERARLRFFLDGEAREALEGDTVLTALLSAGRWLRSSEFGPEKRAGFCLMGACQDCWVWQEGGSRIRACSTPVAPDMRLLTEPPGSWP